MTGISAVQEKHRSYLLAYPPTRRQLAPREIFFAGGGPQATVRVMTLAAVGSAP